MPPHREVDQRSGASHRSSISVRRTGSIHSFTMKKVKVESA